MVKLTALIKEKTLINSNADWNPLSDFMCETEKQMKFRSMDLMIRKNRQYGMAKVSEAQQNL